jgi:hypothetical protein
MIPREFMSREDLERALGRLPRRIAYPIILAVSIALWSAVGIAALKLAQVIAS